MSFDQELLEELAVIKDGDSGMEVWVTRDGKVVETDVPIWSPEAGRARARAVKWGMTVGRRTGSRYVPMPVEPDEWGGKVEMRSYGLGFKVSREDYENTMERMTRKRNVFVRFLAWLKRYLT